jgi:fructose-1,6-bisphosphatase I
MHPAAYIQSVDLLNDNEKKSLTILIDSLCKGAIEIGNALAYANLTGLTGALELTNVQGEVVQKLDQYANAEIIHCLRKSGVVSVAASEENDTCILFENHTADWVVVFDPLDGSSNLDVNMPVGTILGIYRRINQPANIQDCLQSGTELVAAGYFLFGSAIQFIFTLKKGVYGFAYNRNENSFQCFAQHISFPETEGGCYSVNESNLATFPVAVQRYIQELKQRIPPLNLRYVGALVADFHRNLFKGGIFLYPGTVEKPEGKLRLLYEANPLALIAEQAGGKASNGIQNIRVLQPKSLHQRTTLIIGSKKEVERVEFWMQS